MNSVFIVALVAYLIVFLVIGILDMRKTESFEDYAVAGRRHGTFAVSMTLLATVVGASTTIGIVDTVYSIGFPGIWWLLFGSIGLIAQSFVISEKVRDTGAATLPELAGMTVGKAAEFIIALVIVISWIGVIAGQMVAMNGIIALAIGRNSLFIQIFISLFIIIYTMTGGQTSVVKTDKIQFVIIILGIAICFIYLFFVKGGNTVDIARGIELLNKDYRPVNLFNQLFIIGGVYFLGPDIMSRNFLSKDSKTAKKSALIAGICLAAFSLIITLIGMWIRSNVLPEELAGSKALLYVIGIMPKVPAVILIFGLLSAIISSTDTCLINASVILSKDILGKNSLVTSRIAVACIGIVAMVLAIMGSGDILNLLTGAYSIYTPGVIFPLFIAVLCYKKKNINVGIWVTAVVTGGLFGIAGTYFGGLMLKAGVPQGLMTYLPLIGMFVSLVLSMLSIRSSQKENISQE